MPKILIVDDDTVLGRMYKSKFKSQGFESEHVSNGEEALKIIEDFIPDLILTDIMMPKVSGLELIDELKKNKLTANIPIVTMTNLKDEKNKMAALQKGAVEHIFKNEQSLKEVVSKINNYVKVEHPS